MGWKQAVLSAGVSSTSSKKRNIERLKNLTIEERRQLVLRYARRSTNKQQLRKCAMGSSRTNLNSLKCSHNQYSNDIEYIPVEVDKKIASLRGTFVIPTQSANGEYEPSSIISGYSQCTGTAGSVPTMPIAGQFENSSSSLARGIFSAPESITPSELQEAIEKHNNHTNKNAKQQEESEESPRSSSEIPLYNSNLNLHDIRQLPSGYTDGSIISTNTEIQSGTNIRFRDQNLSDCTNMTENKEEIRSSAGCDNQERDSKTQTTLHTNSQHKDNAYQEHQEQISKIKDPYLGTNDQTTSINYSREQTTNNDSNTNSNSNSFQNQSLEFSLNNENSQTKEEKREEEEAESASNKSRIYNKAPAFSASFNDFEFAQSNTQEPNLRSSLKEILGEPPPPIPRRLRVDTASPPTANRPKSMSWANTKDQSAIRSDWSKNKPLQHFDSIKFEDLGSSDDDSQEVLINEAHETIGNWTDRFQTTLENLRSFTANTPLDQLIDGNAELLYLAQDFLHCAETYGRIIISERFLAPSSKTIKPISLGGVSGGEKYIVHHTLFKFAVDSYGILGSDYAAAKVAG